MAHLPHEGNSAIILENEADISHWPGWFPAEVLGALLAWPATVAGLAEIQGRSSRTFDVPDFNAIEDERYFRVAVVILPSTVAGLIARPGGVGIGFYLLVVDVDDPVNWDPIAGVHAGHIGSILVQRGISDLNHNGDIGGDRVSFSIVVLIAAQDSNVRLGLALRESYRKLSLLAPPCR